MLASSDMPLLAVEGASLVYGGVLRAVDRVSFRLNAGHTLGLVGESGSGKSSLARLVLGLVPASEGVVRIDGQNIAALRGAEGKRFRRTAQMIFQDPVAALSPRLRIRDLLAEPLVIHGTRRSDGWPWVRELLHRVGLPETVLDKYPHQISGGQARRVGIARALVLRPRLLVADEPTAGLDVSVQGEVVNLLSELQSTFDLAYLFVSHNLDVVRAVSDMVAVMYLGRIVEHGPADAIFARPAHPYTRALLASTPRVHAADGMLKTGRLRPLLPGEIPSPLAPPAGCPFHTRCPSVQPRCRVEVPEPSQPMPDRTVRCHFPL